TAVTLNGANFGATKGTSVVQFLGFTQTATSWSDTSLSFNVEGTVGTGAVVVVVSGRGSNTVLFTMVPTIQVAPSWGPVGTLLTISGAHFGATQAPGSTVTIGGLPASPTSWSETSIKVPVPNGAPVDGVDVVVTVDGVRNSWRFTVTPALVVVSPGSGAA